MGVLCENVFLLLFFFLLKYGVQYAYIKKECAGMNSNTSLICPSQCGIERTCDTFLYTPYLNMQTDASMP